MFIVSKSNFEFINVIGCGAFGKVWKVNYKKNRKYYVIKEISKEKVIINKCEKEIIQEKEILSTIHSK